MVYAKGYEGLETRFETEWIDEVTLAVTLPDLTEITLTDDSSSGRIIVHNENGGGDPEYISYDEYQEFPKCYAGYINIYQPGLNAADPNVVVTFEE